MEMMWSDGEASANRTQCNEGMHLDMAEGVVKGGIERLVVDWLTIGHEATLRERLNPPSSQTPMQVRL